MFGNGLGTTARGKGRIKERLEDAFVGQLHLAVFTGREDGTLTDRLYRELEGLHERMTSAEDTTGDGTIRATIAVMTEDEAVEIVRLIEGIGYELRRLREDAATA